MAHGMNGHTDTPCTLIHAPHSCHVHVCMCVINIFYCSVYPFVRLSFSSSLFTWGLTYGCAHLARLRLRVRLGCTSTVLPRPSVSCIPRREGLCGTSSTPKSPVQPKTTAPGTAIPSPSRTQNLLRCEHMWSEQPYEVSNFPETPGDLNFPPFFHAGDRRPNFHKENSRFFAIFSDHFSTLFLRTSRFSSIFPSIFPAILILLSFGFVFGSFVPFHPCFGFFTQMDPEAFWPPEGVLFMMKQEVVKRGWLSDAQSSKKLKGEWKKASTLGMHLVQCRKCNFAW